MVDRLGVLGEQAPLRGDVEGVSGGEDAMKWFDPEYVKTWIGTLGGILIAISILALFNSEFIGGMIVGVIGLMLFLFSFLRRSA